MRHALELGKAGAEALGHLSLPIEKRVLVESLLQIGKLLAAKAAAGAVGSGFGGEPP